MEPKTIKSYQEAVLEKYKREKGGEMLGYLAEPTRKSIREACLWLLDRRREKNDIRTLNRFFQFKEGEDKARHIERLTSEKADKFVPIIQFLKQITKTTSPENIELISWLIDFKPRPLQEYLISIQLIYGGDGSNPEIINEQEEFIDRNVDASEQKKEEERKKQDKAKKEEEKKRRRRIITISISIAFGMTMLILGIQKWSLNNLKNNFNGHECMTWADSLYVKVSCNKGPFSQFGTMVDSLDQMKLEKMRKVKVHAAYQFFSDTGEPLIWYYKKSSNEIEYFTAPGLHPINRETLRKITPYIIQTYVPEHMNKKSSFVSE